MNIISTYNTALRRSNYILLPLLFLCFNSYAITGERTDELNVLNNRAYCEIFYSDSTADCKNVQNDSPRVKIDSRRINAGSRSVKFDALEVKFDTERINFDSPKVDFGSPRINFDSSKVKFDAPKVNFDSLKVNFGSPRINFGSPRINFGSPRINFDSPKVKFDAPKVNFDSPKVNFGSPRINFDSPKVDFDSPKVNLGSPRRCKTVNVFEALTGGDGVGDIRDGSEKAAFTVSYTLNPNVHVKPPKDSNGNDPIKDSDGNYVFSKGENGKYQVVFTDDKGEEHKVETDGFPFTVKDGSGTTYEVAETGEVKP
ncbi:MAG: hypothetical protein LBG92_00880, partial [Prevotellaceae bacterium]|nr:hypothetical protein [Prevotellaceae bacterium]